MSEELEKENQDLKKLAEEREKEIQDLKKLAEELEKENQDLKKLAEEREKENQDLKKLAEELEEENNKLKEKLESLIKPKKDSSNSSIPSSQNRYHKAYPEREKSNSKTGRQIGHKGSNKKLVENPDKIIELKPEKCSHTKKVSYSNHCWT